MNHEGGDKRP